MQNIAECAVLLEKERSKSKKKRDADITKIRGQSCKIRDILMYSNLHKNMHKNTCSMPISIIFAIMK